jgi:hypothetical protein
LITETASVNLRNMLPGTVFRGIHEQGLGAALGATPAKSALTAPKIDHRYAIAIQADDAFRTGRDALLAAGAAVAESGFRQSPWQANGLRFPETSPAA